MFLLINPARHNEIVLRRLDGGSVTEKMWARPNRELLHCVDEALTEWGVAPAEVQGMLVVVGAGGFTSTRLATTIANAWAYVHQTPVASVTLAEAETLSSADLLARCTAVPTSTQIATPTATLARPRYVAATYSASPNIGGVR